MRSLLAYRTPSVIALRRRVFPLIVTKIQLSGVASRKESAMSPRFSTKKAQSGQLIKLEKVESNVRYGSLADIDVCVINVCFAVDCVAKLF
jgi:hypothetical protein